MKKVLSLVLVLSMVLGLTACGGSSETASTTTKSNIKIGMVCIGDETEGYSFSHINAMKTALAELGIDEASQMIFKYKIGATAEAYDACVDLVDQGCNLVITTSYDHQKFCEQAASENPNIQFVAATGDTAAASGLSNFHNSFTNIYEARYVAGIVAGMKIKELDQAGKLTSANKDANGNVKVGYVGAFPFAEVKSGFTAFYLGIKSVYENVVMDVTYTNDWGLMTAEKEAATALINSGCVIIGQHSDTSGAPSATEELASQGKVCYCVGYNVDMSKVAPSTALTSPYNNWTTYYKYIIEQVQKGQDFPQNWAEGFESDTVRLTELTANCAEGTQAKVDEAISAIKAGTLHVFDTDKFTVDGKPVTSFLATDVDGDFVGDKDEAIFDGYFHESYFQSAPAFSLMIDGITALN